MPTTEQQQTIERTPQAIGANPTPQERVSPTDVRVRAFQDADYDDVLAVHNDSFPDYPETVAEWRHADSHRDPDHHFERQVAVDVTGRIVGYGMLSHHPYSYHPRRFWMTVTVEPDHRRRGIGAMLFRTLREHAAELNAVRLSSEVREDHADGVAFASARGFRETMREWESRLDLTAFEPGRWRHALEGLAENGVRICTLAELQESPWFWDRLYDLSCALGADVPSDQPSTAPSKALWLSRSRDNPRLLPDGYFIALDRDSEEMVGLSTLWRCEAEPDLYETGLTGVLRSHRRRGVALAMKVRALTWAKAEGVRATRTWNASTNEGMLAINVALGFERRPAWIRLAWESEPSGGSPSTGSQEPPL